MTNDNGGGPRISVDLSIGKQIDSAFGDVIRGLLQQPSKAAGDLLVDLVGILGDKIKRKRELNVELGLEEVRRLLDAGKVELRDITPPREEEIHLLINGMSLAGDDRIRDLWSGLFAKALEPNSETEAERPFISVLESLSPLDAKVIDLLATIRNVDAELRAKTREFVPKSIVQLTAEEEELLTTIHKENIELRKYLVSSIRQKADEYGLSDTNDPSWAVNLFRQGIIERARVHRSGKLSAFTPQIGDDEDMAQAIRAIHHTVKEMQEMSSRQASPPERFFSRRPIGAQVFPEVQLTAFGERFASACGLI